MAPFWDALKSQRLSVGSTTLNMPSPPPTEVQSSRVIAPEGPFDGILTEPLSWRPP
jgi:hypothetical protein